MVFTPEQKTLMNEMLGAFEGGTFDWFTYNDRVTGEITSVPFGNQITFAVVQTRLAAIFTAIEASTDGREARIVDITAEYKEIALDVVRVSIGGGGGAAGTRYDPDVKREHLKNLLERNLGIQIRQSSSGQFSSARFTIGTGGGGMRSIGVSR